MGQAKHKQDLLPPGCVGHATYVRAPWHFALKVSGDEDYDEALANMIGVAHDALRITASAYRDAEVKGRLKKGDATKLDVSDEEPGTLLLFGEAPLTREFGIIRRIPDGAGEITIDGAKMRPCTVEGLDAYVGEPTSSRSTVYEIVGQILRNADGSALTDPLELCRGSLRWQGRPNRLWRADMSLAYLQVVLRLGTSNGSIGDEAEGLQQHATGFARACEVFPCAESRSLRAHADRRVRRMIEVREDAEEVTVEEIRDLVSAIGENRARGAAHETMMRMTTISEGEALTHAYSVPAWTKPDADPHFIQAMAATARASGIESGTIPEDAGVIAYRKADPDGEGIAAPQLTSIERFCARLAKPRLLASGRAESRLYGIEGGHLAIIDWESKSYVFYWDAR